MAALVAKTNTRESRHKCRLAVIHKRKRVEAERNYQEWLRKMEEDEAQSRRGGIIAGCAVALLVVVLCVIVACVVQQRQRRFMSASEDNLPPRGFPRTHDEVMRETEQMLRDMNSRQRGSRYVEDDPLESLPRTTLSPRPRSNVSSHVELSDASLRERIESSSPSASFSRPRSRVDGDDLAPSAPLPPAPSSNAAPTGQSSNDTNDGLPTYDEVMGK